MSTVWVLAFYSLEPIDDPLELVSRHQEFFQSKDITCRIYISEQGINGQMSASPAHAQEYMEWMRVDPRFQEISYKIHESKAHVFPRKTVKYRKQLVAMDLEVNLRDRGESLTPLEWKAMMENLDEDTLLLDVRNTYEWEVGHFEGSTPVPCETFREFPGYADRLKEERDPTKTKIMMYCTGGIRCEFYSALLKEKGFEKVYQLDGGVIGYGLDQGATHWKGKLFVFDDRLAVPLNDEKPAPISQCRHCSTSNDVYYNCANMDCNDLFLCCITCLHAHQGCCSKECMQKERIRPYRQDGSSVPFRREKKDGR
jgi:UPF0176 protein